MNYDEITAILDEKDDIEVLDSEGILLDSVYVEMECLCSTFSEKENESDELETQPFQSSKKRRKSQTSWKKRPFTIGDCSWNYQPHETYDEELSTPYEMFKEYFTNPIMNALAKNKPIWSFSNGESLHTNAQEIGVLLGIHIKIGALKFPRI